MVTKSWKYLILGAKSASLSIVGVHSNESALVEKSLARALKMQIKKKKCVPQLLVGRKEQHKLAFFFLRCIRENVVRGAASRGKLGA